MAESRIKNLGAVTMITPINSNRKDLEDSIKQDKEVLERMKQMSLESLKYNHEPRSLGGASKGDIHPLVEKYNPKPKVKSEKMKDEKEHIRSQRLKFFNKP
jgi:hypothetical protein